GASVGALASVAGRVHPARTRDAVLVSATPPPHARGRLYRIAILPVQCQQPADRRRAPADRAADGTAGAWVLGRGSSTSSTPGAGEGCGPPASSVERLLQPRDHAEARAVRHRIDVQWAATSDAISGHSSRLMI